MRLFFIVAAQISVKCTFKSIFYERHDNQCTNHDGVIFLKKNSICVALAFQQLQIVIEIIYFQQKTDQQKQKKMYRISFSKIQFYKNTSSPFVFIEIQSETSQLFKINRKKIHNGIARFYGQFFEITTNNLNLIVRIFEKQDKKVPHLIQKFTIKKKTYGLDKKSTHVVQGKNIKIYFDSQKIDNKQQNIQDTFCDLSEQYGIKMYSPRLNIAKKYRQFSAGKKISIKSRKSSQDLDYASSKNSKNTTLTIQSVSSIKQDW